MPKQCGKLSGLRQMIYFGNHVHESDLPVIGHVLCRDDNVPQIPEFCVVGFPGSRRPEALRHHGIEALHEFRPRSGVIYFQKAQSGGRFAPGRPVAGSHLRRAGDLARRTVECLDRFSIDYCVESFDPRPLLWLRRRRPDVLRGQLSQNFHRHPSGQGLWNRLALTNLFYNKPWFPNYSRK